MSEFYWPPGKHPPVALPTHFYIDIGNVCNLRCPFCVTGAKAAKLPPGMMTLADYATILDKVRENARLVSLYNWGEPFMNPDLIEIIRMTTACGIRVHLDSNMSVRDLSAAEADALVGAGLHSLFVSFDGATQATYQKYRVRGRLARVLGNVAMLIESKARLGVIDPFIGFQFHVHAFNEHEMAAALQVAERLHVPISYKRLSAPEEWRSSHHDSDEMYIYHDPHMALAYRPPAAEGPGRIALHAALPNPCRQMFDGTMTVAWNGDVYPCTVVEGPSYALGNLHRSSLFEIWNNPAFQASRRYLRDYGHRQGGISVCENQACALRQKHGAPAA